MPESGKSILQEALGTSRVCGQSKHTSRFKYFVPPTPNEELIRMRREMSELKSLVMKAFGGNGSINVGDANIESPSVERVEENLKDKVVDDEEMANVEEHVNEAVSLALFIIFFIYKAKYFGIKILIYIRDLLRTRRCWRSSEDRS